MKFNINDTVRVRLTDYGRALLRDDWQSTTNIYFARPEQRAIRGEYKPPKEDDHGWSEWQLWALMHSFGEDTWLACPLCFETTIEIPNANTDEIDRLRAELAKANAERDEARRKLCEADANHNMIFFDHSINGYAINTPEREARLRGWDCFAPHTNTTDVPVQNGGEA